MSGVTLEGKPRTASPEAASAQLRRLLADRIALRAAYDITWSGLSKTRSEDEREAWSAGVLRLVTVNAGPACLLAYLNACRDMAASESAILLDAAEALAAICRHAGSRAAAAAIGAFPDARRRLHETADIRRWWRALEAVSESAPESSEVLANNGAAILSAGGVAALENFVTAGLKLGAKDKRKRLAFFALQDETSGQLLDRAAGKLGFPEVEFATKTFVTALWGRPPLLRRAKAGGADETRRRTSIAGPLILMPNVFRGVAAGEAAALYRASAAHAQAHLVLGGPRFPIGQLKSLQVVLVGVIEDARIEELAMRQLPGLRRLWAPYHTAKAGGVATAPSLMARMARALFDPSFADDDNFVSRARTMFAGAMSRLHDPAISREIGMLLGNDLGQMRVQFNAKTYVVEPIYRDDGLGLWDFGDDPQQAADMFDVPIDAVRRERRESSDAPPQAQQQEMTLPGEGRAKPVSSSDSAVVLATYPEWDRTQGMERADWTTVREIMPLAGDPHDIENALDRASDLRLNVKRLVHGVRVGRMTRLKRQIEGHDLDPDALIEAGISLATRQQPDPRIYRASMAQQRDLAVMVLVDVSRSTSDRLKSGETVLDVEKLAVAALGEAMTALDDPFSILAFASDGRDNVQLTTIKAFGEPYGRGAVSRLAGLRSGLSTRLGAALRHAGATIARVRSFRKLVIVLTDGEPSDIDVADPNDLVEDARRAALGLRASGIDGFGVVLEAGGMNSAAKIFGRGNTMLVHRMEELPTRLSQLYFRLARR